MKIAVLGDVHGNLSAFRAVVEDIAAWQPDTVVSVGDIINRGPSPADCLRLVEEKARLDGWQLLRGNHEDYVIDQAGLAAARTGPDRDSFYQAYWTYLQIGRDVAGISAWEDLVELSGPAGSLVRIAHGSVLGSQRGIFPQSPDDDLLVKGGRPAPAVFCGGHTHAAFTRTVAGTLFVNAGSVGIPFDGDWRAGYARLTWAEARWHAEIVRLSYPRDQTLAEYAESGFLTEAGPIAWLVLAEYLFASSQLYRWHRDYLEPVTAGEITIESAVVEQLEKQGMWEAVRKRLP